MSPHRSPDYLQLLGPGGALEKAAALYEYRPCQVEMAGEVWKTFRGGGTLLAEAGTGTGKSLAYLLPALHSDHRVVVSTGTKALQEQLSRKDIPLCARLLGRPVRAVTVKGRANYLCLHYWARFLTEPLLRDRSEIQHLKTLSRWAAETKTGDRAELEGVPEELALWQDVSARGERCLGSRCPAYRECFITRMRREAEAAEVVVTNHHLLFADRMVRARADAAVLPEYTHLVLDEAHDAEDAATSFFGCSASRRMLQEWVQDASRTVPGDKSALLGALKESGDAAVRFFDLWGGEDRKEVFHPRECPPGAAGLRHRMEAALDQASLQLETAGMGEEALGLLERLEGWRESFSFVFDESDDSFVRVLEVRGRNVVLSASPIEVAPLLAERLWSHLKASVLTSATLTTGGSFAFLRDRLGVPDDAQELRLQSPFDFASQGLFYVPAGLPEPTSPAFLEAAREEVRELVHASRGRAFVLCTSYRNMRAMAEHLASTVPFPLLVQGDEPKGILLERFREAGNAVLVATSSFWQGVDIQGEALSLVVLDKLPFAPPDDPLTAARVDRMRRRGRDPFHEYQLPCAAILLQQGAGRLIRSRQDRGVVACLDVRLRRKGYGRLLMSSLPPFATAGDLDEVRAFFQN